MARVTLDDAVDLVLFAFEHGKPGDMFVQKAPAATLLTLAESLKQLLHVNNPVNVIGTRHGEKLYETLLTREERAKSEDLGGYFRVSADNRDLNYSLYFSKGVEQHHELEDYNSHNTTRLDRAGMCDLLLKLADVRKACATAAPAELSLAV